MLGARSLAHPLLAGIFVYGGLESLRHAKAQVPIAEDVAQPIADAAPIDLPSETEQLVKLNGAVQVAGGLLLATGRMPRVAALALAATLVPTTAAGHRFWEAQDDATKAQQTIHFLKNASILGGLILAALDTEGRPSLVWRAKRTGRAARSQAGEIVAHTTDRVSSLVPTH
jgi:putative oxidoreductase